jgi:hypothetical protein
MCPRCGKNAPVIYRGVVAYCSACNAPRPPLTGQSLHLAGQPARVGGVVARIAGWLVLGAGLTVALALALVAHALFPAGIVGWLLGGPIALVSVVVALFLLKGGARLGESGEAAGRQARARAVYALAEHRGGRLTAVDVATALEIPVAEADAVLATLAREDYERVAVDVDANGAVVYRFVPGPDARVRVDPEIAKSPNREEWERLEEAERARDPQRAKRV